MHEGAGDKHEDHEEDEDALPADLGEQVAHAELVRVLRRPGEALRRHVAHDRIGLQDHGGDEEPGTELLGGRGLQRVQRGVLGAAGLHREHDLVPVEHGRKHREDQRQRGDVHEQALHKVGDKHGQVAPAQHEEERKGHHDSDDDRIGRQAEPQQHETGLQADQGHQEFGGDERHKAEGDHARQPGDPRAQRADRPAVPPFQELGDRHAAGLPEPVHAEARDCK
ncbi:MAG: hypothetical protein U1G05_09350 [Kiritimatiellia bacterium]